MTRALFCLLVLLGTLSTATAGVAVGADVYTHIQTDREKRDVAGGEQMQKTTDVGVRLTPSVIVMAGSRLEIVPRAGIAVSRQKRVVESPDGTENETYNRKGVGWGGGCGVYPRLIGGDVFRLSLGPDVLFWLYNPEGEENNTLSWQGSVPVNMDFLLGRRVFLRVSPRLITVSYEREDQGSDDYDSEFNILTLVTVWSLTAGLFVDF